MRYKRYRDIEERLGELLRLIRSGRHTTRTLACELNVSRPTVSRDIVLCVARIRHPRSKGRCELGLRVN